MPEADNAEEKSYYEDIPQRNSAFFLKGAGAYDWGMQNRLARVFNPDSGKTVMLAVDHGYFMGPTSGLERIDVNIVPLVPYTDALFCTRGILRTSSPRRPGRRTSCAPAAVPRSSRSCRTSRSPWTWRMPSG